MVLIVTAVVTGCQKPQPTAANSSQAISQAEAMQTTEDKAKYLIDQANAFIATKQYEEAITTAQYVLSNVKADSQEAKAVLEKAANELKNNVQQTASQAQEGVNKMLGR